MSDIFDQLASGNNSPQAQPPVAAPQSGAAPAQQSTTASQPPQAQGGDIFSQLASQSGLQSQQGSQQPSNPGIIHIDSGDNLATKLGCGSPWTMTWLRITFRGTRHATGASTGILTREQPSRVSASRLSHHYQRFIEYLTAIAQEL